MRRIIEINKKNNLFNKSEKLKVCAYIRVSTESVGQINSFNNQKQYYENKIKSNPNYDYCGIFSDCGISGAKEERPGFMQMIRKAKSGGIDLIITKSVSRFARNTIILLKNVRELKAMGVGVVFEEQKINSLNSEGELMLTVLGAIAEEERKNVRSNVKWSIQKKFKSGEVMIDTNRLLGYTKSKEGNIVIDKSQAKIVRRIYKMYLEGISAYSIAIKLNKENIQTYTSKPWNSSRILSIISNEKYKGDCMMQKTFVTDNGKGIINKGQKDKYYVENSHTAIINRNDWERAQVIRAGRKTKIYQFTGLIKCPYCGATLIRVVHEKRWVSWICATYMQKGKEACAGMRISNNKLELLINEELKETMVLKEVKDGKEGKKNFDLIPAKEYFSRVNNK